MARCLSRYAALASLLLAACQQQPGPIGAIPDVGGKADEIAGQDAGSDAGDDLSIVAGGSLVLAGGGKAPDVFYQTIIDLAGGAARARIGIITAGSVPESQDPDASTPAAYNARANGQWYVDKLGDMGVARVSWIPVDLDHVANNAAPGVVQQARSMTGFIFGSGDQSRIIACLVLPGGQDSPLLAAIRQRLAAGAVVAGTSAGTAVQPVGAMVTGGESYEALRYGPQTTHDPHAPDRLTYRAEGGLGFFTHGLIDTHFCERGRQGRMIRLAADTGASLAFGVDESTALVVEHAGTAATEMRVIGAHGVTVLDLSAATVGSGSPWSITGVALTYLSRGDRYLPAAGTLVPPAWKTPLAGREYYTSPLVPSNDIFSSPNNLFGGERKNPRELVQVASRLVDHQSASSTHGLTHETGPTFKVTLTRSAALGTEGFQGHEQGENVYAFSRLGLAIGAP